MSPFITGGTGFLGSYVLTNYLRTTEAHLCVLTRAANRPAAVAKLWKSLQLHMNFEEFEAYLPRLSAVQGDLHAPGLGLSESDHSQVLESCDSILHIAASLNRKSAKSCLNSNLRGTLSVVKLGRELADRGHLERFSHVSTVAVAGQRDREVVLEDEAIDWGRSDYDPYGRTKKFCEHMVRELLPDTPLTFFRPSIVMGDSRFPQTTQFDMVRAFAFSHKCTSYPCRVTYVLISSTQTLLAQPSHTCIKSASPIIKSTTCRAGRRRRQPLRLAVR